MLTDEHDFLHPRFSRRCVSRKVGLAFLFTGYFLFVVVDFYSSLGSPDFRLACLLAISRLRQPTCGLKAVTINSSRLTASTDYETLLDY